MKLDLSPFICLKITFCSKHIHRRIEERPFIGDQEKRLNLTKNNGSRKDIKFQ